MLLSMTGYGRGIKTFREKTITIEIRSLNSKFTDLRLKLPQNYKDKEHFLRKVITKETHRGKIDLSISVTSLAGADDYGLNKSLFKKYYQELKALSTELEMPPGDLMQAVLKLPNVITSEEGSIDDEEWEAVQETLKEAISNFTAFRRTEGEVMKADCLSHSEHILEALKKIEPFETERVEKLRKRITQNMDEYVGKDNIDANRFEQEILYYLEKIDVTEEKVRLEQHCKYFAEVLETKNSSKGKKLSFISQEMGREINTLGSKANSSDIQRLVVQMKDELEKIKEQVLNAV
ncbi:MAG: YicC/YloC family endoribonuclease [Saprospiraceae bacterium]